jgi:hypothetical protein
VTLPHIQHQKTQGCQAHLEIDEEQIIIICAEVDEEHGPELPFMKACPGQQEVLEQFLTDLQTQGSRLAVSKERLEKAPLLEWNYIAGEGGYRCVPKDANGVECSVVPATKKTVEFKEAPGPTTNSMNGNFADFEKSIYLGVGAGPTSLLSLTSPFNVPTPSRSYTKWTPVPSDGEDVPPSGYYELF